MTVGLSRTAGYGRAAGPVRLVHMGLGNFFRAHQAWYTDHSPDAAQWGYAAFSGRGSGDLSDQLLAQDNLYTLVTRREGDDGFEVVSSLSEAHSALDHEVWLAHFRSPDLRVVTLTITEAGYLSRSGGRLDQDRAEVQADLAALREDTAAVVRTAPARLVAGMMARRSADAGAITVVPCDNVPANGRLTERVLRDVADLLDPSLIEWLEASVSVVTTAVDRITPRPTAKDIEAVRDATGRSDPCALVTEPFAEWVISGEFPGGRPSWQDAGVTFTDDVTPFEHRKLWLLNGGHSLLAYAGLARGHSTVADAIGDDVCRDWLEQWWDVAAAHLDQPATDISSYRSALLERFANPRLNHQLSQIAIDGSQKLGIRVVPVLHAERAAGRLPLAATRILAAWVCCWLDSSSSLSDVQSRELLAARGVPIVDAVRRMLNLLDPELGGDGGVITAVIEQCGHLRAEFVHRSR